MSIGPVTLSILIVLGVYALLCGLAEHLVFSPKSKAPKSKLPVARVTKVPKQTSAKDALTVEKSNHDKLKKEFDKMSILYREADADRSRIGTLLSKEMSKNFRPIQYHFQYNRVLSKIEKLGRPEPGTAKSYELEILKILVEGHNKNILK